MPCLAGTVLLRMLGYFLATAWMPSKIAWASGSCPAMIAVMIAPWPRVAEVVRVAVVLTTYPPQPFPT
jgi:hypothetical protein